MSRLASFQGPSTPSKTPVNPSEQASPSPASKSKNSVKRKQPVKSVPTIRSQDASGSPAPPSPSQRKGNTPTSPTSVARNESSSLSSIVLALNSDMSETPVHKRLRQTLLEIRSTARGWEELTKVEGFKAAKEIVDSRTLIENALATVSKDQMPSKFVVGPHMRVINEGIKRLEGVLANLRVLLSRFNSLVESLETLHMEALNDFHSLPASTSSPLLDPDAPLYPNNTWSLARFTTLLPQLILPYYARSLVWHQYAARRIASSGLKWEDARVFLGAWKEGEFWSGDVEAGSGRMVCVEGLVLECGWSAELEDICAIEISGWK